MNLQLYFLQESHIFKTQQTARLTQFGMIWTFPGEPSLKLKIKITYFLVQSKEIWEISSLPRCE